MSNTHTPKVYVPSTSVLMFEVEMLWEGHGHLRFRVPNFKLIRAIRQSQYAGMKIVAVSCGSCTPQNDIVSMLRTYGITPAHVALTPFDTSRLKEALLYRHRPAFVYESCPLLAKKFADLGIMVITN